MLLLEQAGQARECCAVKCVVVDCEAAVAEISQGLVVLAACGKERRRSPLLDERKRVTDDNPGLCAILCVVPADEAVLHKELLGLVPRPFEPLALGHVHRGMFLHHRRRAIRAVTHQHGLVGALPYDSGEILGQKVFDRFTKPLRLVHSFLGQGAGGLREWP